MKKIILTCLLCAIFAISHAGEADKIKNIEKLLILTQTEKMIDTMTVQIDQMMQGWAQQLGLKPSEQKYMDKFVQKVTAAKKKELNWEILKKPMVDLYDKHYTDKEIADMITFYSSETGKSVIKKMPVVMQESMMVSQNVLQDFLPRVQAMAVELQKELSAARQQKEP